MALHSKKRKKISLDLDMDVYNLLDSYAKKIGVSNGPLINKLLDAFLNLDKRSKYTLAKTVDGRINQIKEEESQYSLLEKASAQNQIETLKSLLTLLTNGQGFVNDTAINQNMRRVDLKDGYVIFPSDWVVLENINPKDCLFAGIIEFRNGTLYNAPHYVFFWDEPINLMSDNEINELNNKFCKMDKQFKKLLNLEVKPLFDEKHNLVNAEIWNKAPEAGYFMIPDFGSDLTYPYGAMIYRDDAHED